jgi:hypothetical protein
MEGLLPALPELTKSHSSVILALLDQLIPLINFSKEHYGQDAYKKAVECIFPILDKQIYAENIDISKKAVTVLTSMRNVVEEKEKEHIMNITMKMAHDEDQAHKETAVNLLQYLASAMGEEIC